MVSQSRHLTPDWQCQGDSGSPRWALSRKCSLWARASPVYSPEGLFLQCAAASCPEHPGPGSVTDSSVVPGSHGHSPEAAAWRFINASSPVSAQCLPLCPQPLLFCPTATLSLAQRRKEKVWGPPHPLPAVIVGSVAVLALTPGSLASLQMAVSDQRRKDMCFPV